ncbi:MAG: tetratricopeptide repeat protein [Nitrospinota bacterium]
MIRLALPITLLTLSLTSLTFAGAPLEEAMRAFNRGNELLRAGDRDGAASAYKKALELSPSLYSAHHQLGEIAFKTKDLKEAIRHYRAALKQNPGYSPSRLRLARCYELLGARERAIFHYEEFLKGEPEAASAQYRLGLLYRDSGRYSLSIHHLRKALEVEPGNRNFLYQLWSIHALHRPSRKLEFKYGVRLVELKDFRPIEFYRARASLNYRAARFEAAVRDARMAIEINPDWRKERWRGALEELKRYRAALEVQKKRGRKP